jgi:hypothetical protein
MRNNGNLFAIKTKNTPYENPTFFSLTFSVFAWVWAEN